MPWCSSETGAHCDHTVHFSADLSLWLDSRPTCLLPAVFFQFNPEERWGMGRPKCKLGVISQERLKIEAKLILSANKKSYMPHRLKDTKEQTRKYPAACATNNFWQQFLWFLNRYTSIAVTVWSASRTVRVIVQTNSSWRFSCTTLSFTSETWLTSYWQIAISSNIQLLTHGLRYSIQRFVFTVCTNQLSVGLFLNYFRPNCILSVRKCMNVCMF